MSALPPKADMCGATSDVRFGPEADKRGLFDHFVGAVGALFSRKPPREIQKPDHIGDSPRVKTAKSAVHAKMITAQLSTTPRVSSTIAFATAQKWLSKNDQFGLLATVLAFENTQLGI